MSYVVETRRYRPGSSGRPFLESIERTAYVQSQDVVEHIVSIMTKRGERFSGMEDWDLDTCRAWLATALDQSADIGDLCIGGREWATVCIWAKL